MRTNRRTDRRTWLCGAVGAAGVWSLLGRCHPAAAQEDPAVRILELPAGAKPPVLTAVAISPDGDLLATAGDDHVIRIWSLRKNQLVHTLRGHRDWVRTLAFSPAGARLASAGDDRRVLLWDAGAGQLEREATATTWAVYSLAFRPDGKRLAAAGFSTEVRVYDPASGDVAQNLTGPNDDLRCAAYSPDGKLLAVAGRAGIVRMWDAGSLKPARDLQASSRRIWAGAFSADSQLLAVAGDERQIRLWAPHTGDEAGALAVPAGKVLAVTFCGQKLATGGTDNSIHLWDVAAMQHVRQLKGHTGSVASLAFHAGTNMLVSGSFDTSARVWAIPARDVVRREGYPPR
jgi:WD40 repeat protein